MTSLSKPSIPCLLPITWSHDHQALYEHTCSTVSQRSQIKKAIRLGFIQRKRETSQKTKSKEPKKVLSQRIKRHFQ